MIRHCKIAFTKLCTRHVCHKLAALLSKSWILIAQQFQKLVYHNNNNNTPIYKAPEALASEVLAAAQSWVLIKSLTEEVRLKPRFT